MGGDAPAPAEGSPRGAVALIRANSPFTRLWAARSTSSFGDSMSLVALMLYVAGSTGTALAVALLLLVGDFAPALLGPFTGALTDRFDLTRVMVTCELLAAGLVVVIAVRLPALPMLLVLVALRAIAGQVFQPASRAAVAALVEDRDLAGANTAIGFGTNGSEALGPLAAAVLVPVLGVRGILLVDAATFVVSAAVLVFLPAMPHHAPAIDARTSFLHDVTAGIAYIWASPIVRAVGLGFCGVVAFNGIDDVALVFLATDTLGGGDSAVGLLLAAVGIGLLAGYALLGRGAGRASTVVLLIAGLALSSAGNLLTGLAWAVAAAFIVQAVRGIGIAAMDVAVNTIVQRTVPAAMLGRVFGNLYGAVGVAAALAYVGGGLLLDATDPRTTFVLAGGGGLAVTIATALALRAADRAGGPPPTGIRP